MPCVNDDWSASNHRCYTYDMFIAAVVVSSLLAVGLIGSGRAKLVKEPAVTANMAKVGVPEHRLWPLAVLEIAGAVGLLIGLVWWPLGVAAAIGVVLYFVGALSFHARARDTSVALPLAFLLMAVTALVLRLITR